MANEYNHIFLNGRARSEPFTTPSNGGGGSSYPDRDRQSHAQYLIRKFGEIARQIQSTSERRSVLGLPTRTGTYLQFSDDTSRPLLTKGLELRRKGISLLNVQHSELGGSKLTKAIIYIPQGMEGEFLQKISDYQDEEKATRTGKPKNEPLVASIADFQIPLLEAFWLESEREKIPSAEPTWCEAWIRIKEIRSPVEEQIEHFRSTLLSIGIEAKSQYIHFVERAVLLIKANRAMLNELMMRSDQLAELRIAQEVPGFWIRNNSRSEQQEWIDDLLGRLDWVDTNVKVCILDSGVNNGHPLLKPLLSDEDCMTVDPSWGTEDVSMVGGRRGHGTLMAGIAGFGDLQASLEHSSAIRMYHRLCSVKILPRIGGSDRELWGDITAQGVARAEEQNPNDRLLFCMAITSHEDTYLGRPSSWSGMIDTITYGEEDQKRLMIISGGNISDEMHWQNFPESNLICSVQNPAQAWNSLSVGAYTEKVIVDDPSLGPISGIASAGQISPYSSTSFNWDIKKWPIKPDVVFEGGNIAKFYDNGEAKHEDHEDLQVLSTSKNFGSNYFDSFGGTSPATAQAAWLGSQIKYKYPNAWPETVRALIVHSAFWTEAMKTQFGFNETPRKNMHAMLRACGYGVPDVARTLSSYESAFTFISQEYIRPYRLEGSQGKMNEMHFYDLPWPKEQLVELGSTEVRVRITLSYFVEPSPGEIGWQDKYRYQSFGLRFEMNNVNDDQEIFTKRINKAAREEADIVEGSSGSDRWELGKDNRSLGSIHSDYWIGNAVDLADCNMIAVFPVVGWWRERHHLGKCNSVARYSLLVSLETPEVDVELYSAVQQIITTQVPIDI